MQVICSAPEECETCLQADEASQGRFLAEHIQDELDNEEAVQLMETLAMESHEEGTRLLREAAANAGLEGCAYADWFEQWAQPAEQTIE